MTGLDGKRFQPRVARLLLDRDVFCIRVALLKEKGKQIPEIQQAFGTGKSATYNAWMQGRRVLANFE